MNVGSGPGNWQKFKNNTGIKQTGKKETTTYRGSCKSTLLLQKNNVAPTD